MNDSPADDRSHLDLSNPDLSRPDLPSEAVANWPSSSETVNELLRKRRVLLVLGSGGVGKTTVSASLALRAALNQQNASVCTIDPAKRLATALNIELSGAEQRVQGLPEGSGTLNASMLDPQAVFRSIIEEHAPSHERAETILNNALYQRLAAQTAGIQEFMAAERLLQLRNQDSERLIVLDTPPTRHAIDFLTAPERMLKLLNHSSIQWVVQPDSGGFSFTRSLAQSALKKLSNTLDQVFGLQLLKDLREFFQAFDGMYEGFAERAQQVRSILQSEQTGIIIVTSAQSQALQEAELLADELSKLKLNLDGIIFNKMLIDFQDCPVGLLERPELPDHVHYWHSVASAEKARAEHYVARFHGQNQNFQIGQLSSELNQPNKLKGLAAISAEMRQL